MRVASVLKLWAGITPATSYIGRPASPLSGTVASRLDHSSASGSCVAFALSTSTPRGIENVVRTRAPTIRSVMTSQVQPTGSDANANAGSGGSGGSGSSSSISTTTKTFTAADMKKNNFSFYRRTLKPPCVAFSSDQGRQLFREALVDGTMEIYFRLAEQFRTQDEPAFCGLSTLTMVLNALAVDPGRIWKGLWRWYHESMLDCCAPLDVVKEKGVTMATMGCLARCNGLKVDMASPDTHSIEDLRTVVEECSMEDRGRVVVASYDRRGVNQTGTGHFSPVGGYHREQDVVLIMDTARFKHPPHWIPLTVLWEAMKRVDPETGKPRGFMVLEKAHNLSHRLFTANSTNYQDWPQVASWVNETIRQASGAPEESTGGSEGQAIAPVADNGLGGLRNATTMAEFVPLFLTLLPPAVKGLLTTFNSAEPEQASGGTGTPQDQKLPDEEEEEEEQQQQPHDDTKFQDGVVLQALQGTEVYRELAKMGQSRQHSSGSASADSASTRTDGCDGKNAPGCCESGGTAKVGAGNGPNPQQAASPVLARPSPSTFWPNESDCGCSSRHLVTIVAYAVLLLLHKQDHEADGGAGPGLEEDGDEDGGGGISEPLWRKDPLRRLPAPVADETKHVAGMLRGLVEMEICERCTAL